MANLQVDDLPLIPDANNADLYAAKSNLDYRVRSGEANGIATLDGAGKVPSSQLPLLNYLPLTGGTLTGNLNGTTATFSGQLTAAGLRSSSGVVTGTGANAIFANEATGSVFIRPDTAGSVTGELVVNTAFIQWNGSTVWTAGNDGTGSGLDADLLDGLQGAAYPVLANYNIFSNKNTFNANVGIGTDPEAAPSIGNPTFGTNNIIQYAANNVVHRLLSDSAAPRTQQVTFGAAGVGIADAGLQWTTNIRNLEFIAGGAVRLSMDTAGTSTFSATVLASSFTSNGSVFRSAVNQLVLANTGAGTMFFRPQSEGSASGQMLLDSAGNCSATNFTATSDLTLKNVIGTVAPRDFSTLDIIDWTWKDDGKYGIGVGAQNVKAIAKEYVHENSEGTLSVDKGGLALEWAASLEKKIKMLEARLRDLEEKLK